MFSRCILAKCFWLPWLCTPWGIRLCNVWLGQVQDVSSLRSNYLVEKIISQSINLAINFQKQMKKVKFTNTTTRKSASDEETIEKSTKKC